MPSAFAIAPTGWQGGAMPGHELPSRGRISPGSPGKENFPPEHEARGRAESKSNKIGFLRGLSPERKGKKEARGRSVSPSKRDKYKAKDESATHVMRSSGEIDQAFAGMLNEMEVPSTLRVKLMTMNSKVKESMMKGQATLSLGALMEATCNKSRPALPDQIKRSKSSTSILGGDSWDDMQAMFPPDRSIIFGGPKSRQVSSRSVGSDEASRSKVAGTSSSPYVSGTGPRSRSGSFSSMNFGASGSASSASSFATMLKTTDSSRLDIARVKKMRAVLSSESPSWISEFVEEGGYCAMVIRLNELLNLEWREEQHDDQLLHELLRCFVALSTTVTGRTSLRTMLPSPFVGLSDLLFSEKRPGDLTTRKLLIELLTLLADLPCSSVDISSVREARETSSVSSNLHSSDPAFALLFVLLHNLRDPLQEAKVDFIKASHAPRPFKSFVTEMLNVNRDYFWVFCHANRFWSLQDIDINEVECPKVPGGMTGGVEFEAMAYLTSLFRLLNTTCLKVAQTSKISGDGSALHSLHSLLFSSGIERALIMTRKASQTYYQPLHLELARYFDHARQAGFRLSAELEAWQSRPHLLTTESRYSQVRAEPQEMDRSVKQTPRALESYRSPTKDGKSDHGASGTCSAQENGGSFSPQAPAASGQSGRWLGGQKRAGSRPPTEVMGTGGGDRPLGPALPNPHLDEERDITNDRVSTSTIVGSAVQRWELLATKQHSGLGLGWAPSR